VKWRNDPDVYGCFYEHEPLSLAMQHRWYEAFLQRADEKYWLAETLAEAQPVGTIALVHLDRRNRRAELGRVLIAPDSLRQGGIGTELCELALDYAFGHLDLNRVYLDVFADNAPAIALYKKLGFHEEGLLRQHVFARGKHRDVLVFALLAEEFWNQSRAKERA
jgi:UDP-4-amino-4,6-dideoxy-N-acetyl-beta-L-altrosamine N-acetyltransferase